MEDIKIRPYATLTAGELDSIQQIETSSFGDQSILSVFEMSKPDFAVTCFRKKEIVGNVNLVEREALFDDKKMKVVGINYLVVKSDFRRQGIAAQLLKQARMYMFDELHADWSLLVCSDKLVPFYERMRWSEVKCPMLFDQPSEKKIWREHVFVLSHKHIKFNHQKIDLCGPPW